MIMDGQKRHGAARKYIQSFYHIKEKRRRTRMLKIFEKFTALLVEIHRLSVPSSHHESERSVSRRTHTRVYEI